MTVKFKFEQIEDKRLSNIVVMDIIELFVTAEKKLAFIDVDGDTWESPKAITKKSYLKVSDELFDTGKVDLTAFGDFINLTCEMEEEGKNKTAETT